MHEKYRFFYLYVVQKSPKIFLYEPKKLCKLQKKNTAYEYKKVPKMDEKLLYF